MAKRKRRVLPARKEKRDDDSLLVRSAESLGRVIGSLQRQVRGTARGASAIADDAMKTLPELPRFDNLFGESVRTWTRARKTPPGRKTAAGRKTTGARKTTRARTRTTSRKAAKKR